MYTTEEGYKITVFHAARKKQHSFTKLGSRSYIENELKDLGFSVDDITAATYTRLTLEELNQEIEAIETDWNNY